MSNCPECNKAMGLHDLFVAGLCPSCAGEYITYKAKRIAELEAALEKYGRHIYCGNYRLYRNQAGTLKCRDCDCGFEKALKGE